MFNSKYLFFSSSTHAFFFSYSASSSSNVFNIISHRHYTKSYKIFTDTKKTYGGPAPVRQYLPELIDLILGGEIDPGKVFDLELSLDDAAEGYRAMDERRAIKALLRP